MRRAGKLKIEISKRMENGGVSGSLSCHEPDGTQTTVWTAGENEGKMLGLLSNFFARIRK